ncbi:unnamed protein product, partial [Mycena citricolor]
STLPPGAKTIASRMSSRKLVWFIDKRLGDIPSSALHTLWQSNAVAQLARVLLPFASLLGPSSVVTDTSFQA